MNNYKLEYQKDENNQMNQLTFSGELSFGHIQYIKDETDEYTRVNKPLQLIIKDVEMLDLSFIQFIIALKNHHPENKITLNINDEILDLIKVSGFYEILIS
ncbi:MULTISPECIES: hypothetical protein [unclassified Lentimicrobium]|uniref:hypothetical protein n=1 Tax=unclassified Lentimicrobium TaxID=2677434 RepID=UPI001556F29B|nr:MULTISPECIES: hypothetical protein [unclassified Lentimicrobium]NPD45674.1 hypothetical protein [Lentimicrobium sp. S6]NPD85553.1 hypothetical protein [Lentimicrobium sp. L6]